MSSAQISPNARDHRREQPKPVTGTDHARKTMAVRAAITAAGEAARARHPWLAHQDAIGLSIQLGAVAGMVLCAVLYLQGYLPWWLTIPMVAILASLTHEIEHDLIHQMYFKKQPWVQNLLLGLGWLARPSTVSPWARRHLHFHHHKRSGTALDLEERGITNGERWGIKRLLMTGDGMLALAFRGRMLTRLTIAFVKDYHQPKTKGQFRLAHLQQVLAYVPLGSAFWFLWHVFVVFHAVDLIMQWSGHPIAWHPRIVRDIGWLDQAAVCILIPNVIRTFCLHFVSSNMHYYGDVEPGNVIQQCQVWNHPALWPLHLFCFNFGSTHGIHHFVVGQPFYLRQMIASQAHEAMRQAGVRFNDFGTFARANRWLPSPRAPSINAA
jgi:fatty acid desaturase